MTTIHSQPLSTPYWWEAAALQTLPQRSLAAKVDVLIVGAGYAGLAASIELARAGRRVLVLDRQHPGEGASTRNGGITSGNIRLSYEQLVRRFGEGRAMQIQAEGKAAREDLQRFIETESIDCDYQSSGMFLGAITKANYEANARHADRLARTLGIETYAVPYAEQHRYIGSDFYRGGTVRFDIGGLHPAKLHAGLLRLAQEAGVTVCDRTAVLAIEREGRDFRVSTTQGPARADSVLVCTNGYTDNFDRWLQRRLVPVRSRIIATEPIPSDVMERLMPRRMMYSDGRQLSYYYRPSPDNSRLLFGGRDGTFSGDPQWPTEHLRAEMVRIFPELDTVRLSHSWFGYVAMHRDMIPRIFNKNGVKYATGFCGSGVVWARWLGIKAARQLLGDTKAGESGFDFRPPKPVPFYRGRPWFIPVVYARMAFSDRRMMNQR